MRSLQPFLYDHQINTVTFELAHPMHTIVWEFTVREEQIAAFISAYDSDGDWAQLFRRADGYLGTELLRSTSSPNVFLTIDRWQSLASFENFLDRFGAEYKKLDALFEGYTLAEKKVGVFSSLLRS